MHYRTDKINFLESEEAFVEALPKAERFSTSSFETEDLEEGDGPIVVVPAAP